MLAGTRIAVSTLVLAAYGVLSLVIALAPDTGVAAFFGSLAAIYAVGVVGLLGRFFWARWFARGVGMWGAFAGAFLMLSTGVGLVLVAFTASHGAVALLLMGEGVAARYDARADWRERWNLDERNAARIADLVTNMGSLLPWVAFYAFFPRMGGAATIVAMALATAGLGGILRMRTWGVLAVAAAAVTLAGAAILSATGWGALFVAGLLGVALSPFARPVVRFMRSHR
jgi:hypothetical protein